MGAGFLGLTASDDEVLEAMEIADLPDDTTEDTGAKRGRYERLAATLADKRLVANTWAASFFWTLRKNDPLPPTQMDIRNMRHRRTLLSPPQLARIAEIAAANHFFHWHLEFPDVFGDDGQGGFDCVLGNPPWERIKLQEEEFFAARDPEIAGAANKAARERLIKALLTRKADAGDGEFEQKLRLAMEFEAAKHAAEAQSKFMRGSGRYPLTGVGDVNTYALFAEHFRVVTGLHGRAGVIVPTGIATDDSTKAFFGSLVGHKVLARLIGCENEAMMFPAVHPFTKFCLLALAGAGSQIEAVQMTFNCRHFEQVNDPIRQFLISPDDIVMVNPNTRTCPVFRTAADAELTKAIYRGVPVLVNEVAGENPWGVSFLRMFDMSSDSGLFEDGGLESRKTRNEDETTEERSVSSVPSVTSVILPLYEAKLLHQYDHRWATYDGKDARDLTAAEKADPHRAVTPRYWVPRAEVEARLADRWYRGWLLGFRDITNGTNERTAIFSLMPRVVVGHTAPLAMIESEDARLAAALLGCLNSMTFDYVTRQKVGGTHLTYTYLRQLPVLPPDHYTAADLGFIVPRVLELVYTAWDMQPFARDLGYEGAPFIWDEARRAVPRAELDAAYARLYGLNRKQLRYILDPHDLTDRELADILDPAEDPPDAPRTTTFPGETFRVLKNREMKEYGEYRTRRMLAAWDGEIRE